MDQLNSNKIHEKEIITLENRVKFYKEIIEIKDSSIESLNETLKIKEQRLKIKDEIIEELKNQLI